MLRKRLLASTLMITPVLVILFLDTSWNFGYPGIWVLMTCLLVSVAVAGELQRMLQEKTPGGIPWVVYTGTILCNVAVIVPELFRLPADCPVNRWGWSGMAIVFTIGAAFLNELCRFAEQRQSTIRIATTLFVVLYSGWLLSFLSAMRIGLGNYRGIAALFSVLFIIKLSDAGAYFAGKRFGRTKLAPVLSPGKTVEGLVGGIVAAMLGGGFACWVVLRQIADSPPPTWWAVLAYSASLGLVGVVGDLSESLIKRDMGLKDSSGWLPGLGGIMDTADSVLLAAPIAFLWWTTGLL